VRVRQSTTLAQVSQTASVGRRGSEAAVRVHTAAADDPPGPQPPVPGGSGDYGDRMPAPAARLQNCAFSVEPSSARVEAAPPETISATRSK